MNINDSLKVDWEAFEKQLDTLFFKGCDTYRAGAAALFGKSLEEVTKNERTLVKLVFMRAFRVRGPMWVQSAFEFADEMVGVLQDRGLWKEISDEAGKRLRAAEEAAEAKSK